MSTHRQSILDWHARPDTSGNCYPTPYTLFATNDVWKHTIFAFRNSGSLRINLYGTFIVPENYVGTAKIVIVWTTQSTTGNVVWDFDYRAVGGNDTESLDQASAQESVSVTDAAPAATDRRLETEVALTSGNLAAEDTVQFLISRDLSDVSDTLSDTAQLFDLIFEYEDA